MRRAPALPPGSFRRDWFSRDVREFRRASGRSLRSCAAVAGVSACTLNRVERNGMPDLVSFGRLCAWMYRIPGAYFTPLP